MRVKKQNSNILKYAIAVFLFIFIVLFIRIMSTDDCVKEPWGTYALIDVRNEDEWNEGHINGAILIPHDKITERIGEIVADKNRPIILYCRSGKRAGIALDALKELGYTNVKSIGGYADAKVKIKDAPSA